VGKASTVFQYDVDDEGARTQAEKLAQKLLRKHSNLHCRVEVKSGEGAYLILYGDEERIRKIIQSASRHQVNWLLAGTPVYIIYGGPKEP